MTLLSLTSNSLWDVEPAGLIEIAAAAGFDAVGLRVHPSPGRPMHRLDGDRALIPALSGGSRS